ncbi:MAG: MBL fold metallo-hydrolase [Thermomicrobiales bacterium]
MTASGLRVHHLPCACIQGVSIHRRPLLCHCLLVETPASGLVLVDTGLGTQDYLHPSSRLGVAFAYGFGRQKRDPSLAAVVQIRKLGYDPADVRHLVMTHLDLDHVGGMSDFPNAAVHVHAAELGAAITRETRKARSRYRPAMWAHGPRFQAYAEEGEPWFGFSAVRSLQGLPPEMLFVPLFGHSEGHSGVAINADSGWMLHAGDAYFDPREVDGKRRKCAPMVGLFQNITNINRPLRLHNQARLRELRQAHPEIEMFCAHNPFEFPGPPVCTW